jgi:hypothetical protein
MRIENNAFVCTAQRYSSVIVISFKGTFYFLLKTSGVPERSTSALLYKKTVTDVPFCASIPRYFIDV